jgi:ketosteroid isomerase-like protein
MSRANVELVRAAFEAWNEGDMDAFRELYDPGAIVGAPDGWPEPGPFVGREAVMRQFEQMRETWDADAVEPISEFIDAADRVVVRFIWRSRGRGPDSNMELTGVYSVRKGRIFRAEFFWDHAEALKAVGPAGRLRSQQNVELVERGLDAFNRRDLHTFAELTTQDCVWFPALP